MKVLVVEDDQKVLASIQKYLQKNNFSADAVATGEDAIAYVQMLTYDVVLLDVNLPDMLGFELCSKLQQHTKNKVPVIMVTARDDVEDKIKGLHAGADDYIVKPFHFEELLARIHAVIRRNNTKSTDDFTIGDVEIMPENAQVLVKDTAIDFSAKEYEIFYYLALSMPNPKTMEDIIDHVWDSEQNPFSNSGRVHIMNIRRKLEAQTDKVTIKNMKNRGYYICTQ